MTATVAQAGRPSEQRDTHWRIQGGPDMQQQIMDILGQTGGLQSVARELGLSESQAATGASALMPALLGGFKKQAQAQPAGLDGLVGMLGGMGGGGLMDEVLAPQPTNVSAGNDILGRIFGSRDVSRTVAQDAASRTGIDPSLLKKMLPVLAMLVAGYMAKRGGRGGDSTAAQPNLGGGGLGDLLGGVLGGNPGAGRTSSNSSGGGVGGLASMLDLDRDGNPLDDILGMAGKFMR
jgi:hypothetical protein